MCEYICLTGSVAHCGLFSRPCILLSVHQHGRGSMCTIYIDLWTADPVLAVLPGGRVHPYQHGRYCYVANDYCPQRQLLIL